MPPMLRALIRFQVISPRSRLRSTARSIRRRRIFLRRSRHLADFIHGFGHFVGLDVHDTGDYEKPLPPGAIITVEPGVYLPERNFGVRIEDMVLITDKGYKLLTADIPRKLED